MKKYTDLELIYAASCRCNCGAGMAYPLNHEDAMELRAWICSKYLKGELANEDPSQHLVADFSITKIREETSINNREKATTRPPGTKILTVGRARCGECKHEWESRPYAAPGLSHHWYPGACPNCGNDCNAAGSHSSQDKRKMIEVMFRDVTSVQPEVSP